VFIELSHGRILGCKQIGRKKTYQLAKETQKKKNILPTQESSGERSSGQGNGRVNDLSEQQGGGNKLENTRVSSSEELKDFVSFTGIVTQTNDDLLVILCENDNEIVVEGRALRFVLDAGFSAEIGDSIALNGFYETTDEFEISYIENLTKNVKVQIREGGGRPLWAGYGRGA
jgi:hypothetical protein